MTAEKKDADLAARADAAVERLAAARASIAKSIVGLDAVVEQSLAVLLSGGHGLLVGAPGLAKTRLVHTLARVAGLEDKRVQFTPDLMPADILGSEVLDQDEAGKRSFRFIPGPVFCQLLMADEINRASPRTQAALLQAMQEGFVTVAGQRHDLPKPFHVLATQNPIEQEGTYPLPEAQLDRFMLNLWLDYPSFDEEAEVVRSTTAGSQNEVEPVMSARELQTYQDFVRQIPVADNVIEYAVTLVTHTRPDADAAPSFIEDYLSYGAGPRASQYLVLGAKTLSALEGRMTPVEADIRRMAVPVLRHRIVPSFNAEADNVSSVDLIERLLEQDSL